MSDAEITTTVVVDDQTAESGTTESVTEDLLVEDVSIDGMCGVY